MSWDMVWIMTGTPMPMASQTSPLPAYTPEWEKWSIVPPKKTTSPGSNWFWSCGGMNVPTPFNWLPSVGRTIPVAW